MTNASRERVPAAGHSQGSKIAGYQFRSWCERQGPAADAVGHASAAMTLNRNADLFDDDLEPVAGALDKARSTQTKILL